MRNEPKTFERSELDSKRDCNWSLSTSLDCDHDCSQSRTRIGCP